MPRLRHVSADMPGWTRRRAGRGFTYLDEEGVKLPDEEIERIKSLAIPPAWKHVWICPLPNGHLQATGIDEAGRKQYLYHPVWRAKRDRSKFDRLLEAAELLPTARRRIARDIASDQPTLEWACATAVRLLDVGYFRIGNDAYTDANGSFGLTTLQRQHVRRRGDGLMFSFTGKSGISHSILVSDEEAVKALEKMRSRRSQSRRLLAHKQGRAWKDLTADDVNAYLSDLFDGVMTAKDFRSWHATVIAAEALALTEEDGATKASRTRAVKQAATEVASYLGNTPTVARNSYIDPRVVDHFEDGETIAEAATKKYPSAQGRQSALEAAVRDLL